MSVELEVGRVVHSFTVLGGTPTEKVLLLRVEVEGGKNVTISDSHICGKITTLDELKDFFTALARIHGSFMPPSVKDRPIHVDR